MRGRAQRTKERIGIIRFQMGTMTMTIRCDWIILQFNNNANKMMLGMFLLI